VEGEFLHLQGFRWRCCAVVVGFGLDRGNVSEDLKQAPVVVPVDPLQGGSSTASSLRQVPLTANQFGLEQADDRFGQGIVEGLSG
jgi:hypothetical protein